MFVSLPGCGRHRGADAGAARRGGLFQSPSFRRRVLGYESKGGTPLLTHTHTHLFVVLVSLLSFSFVHAAISFISFFFF